MSELLMPSHGVRDLLPFFVMESGLTARYGPPSDGGYVVPDLPFNKIITVGVGWNIGFEQDYAVAHPEAEFHLFDPTVPGLMAHLPNSNFRRLGLGFGRNRLSLSEILSLVSVSKTDCVLLKIDCEGAEWEGGIEHADLAGIDAFVIEIHGLGNANLASIQRPVIERLWRDFKCLNIHPCNYGGSFPLDGVRVPRVVELSFLSRRIRQDGFNNPLNHPCNPRADELPWINPCVNSP